MLRKTILRHAFLIGEQESTAASKFEHSYSKVQKFGQDLPKRFSSFLPISRVREGKLKESYISHTYYTTLQKLHGICKKIKNLWPPQKTKNKKFKKKKQKKDSLISQQPFFFNKKTEKTMLENIFAHLVG